MISYLIRRLGYALVMVVLVSFVSFVIINSRLVIYLTQKMAAARTR
jgi:peptide/nickel transport system permease protein